MRKLSLAFALAAAVAFTGAATWGAQAAPTSGAGQLAASAWTVNNIMHAACRHRGAHCPRHFVWNGHRCRPC